MDKISEDKYIVEIREKYKLLNKKMKFVQMIASKTGLDVFTVKNHHFQRFSIPLKYHRPYIKLLDATLAQQKDKADA